MPMETLFCNLTSESIADLIRSAKHSVCFAGPSIQLEPAQAMVEVAVHLGSEMVTVCIDFDERVMRMGYGELSAVKSILDAGITINHSPSLRNALIIVDCEGYAYTPTALLLEPEFKQEFSRNALRLSHDQVAEALARLSPAAKVIAIAQTQNTEEKSRISDLPVEVSSITVSSEQFKQVEQALVNAPPVQFDMARQVRVFETYFQYVDMKLTGAAIQRKTLKLPASIQGFGEEGKIQERLHTTFNLIANDSEFSSKIIEQKLREMRDGLTRPIGKGHGRIVLKSAKPSLVSGLKKLREDLKKHKENVKTGLQNQIDASRKDIIDYYLPLIIKLIEDGTPPLALIGGAKSSPPSEEDARSWLNRELERVFPAAEDLIVKMELEEYYKDVTYETLKQSDFKSKVEKAYPDMDWDSVYDEFNAVGENKE